MTFEDVKAIRSHATLEDVDNKKLSDLIDEAIERQIGAKLKNNKFCPVCNTSYFYSKPKYCSECGQKLNWEDCTNGTR